jgi:hypothetical protein
MYQSNPLLIGAGVKDFPRMLSNGEYLFRKENIGHLLFIFYYSFMMEFMKEKRKIRSSFRPSRIFKKMIFFALHQLFRNYYYMYHLLYLTTKYWHQILLDSIWHVAAWPDRQTYWWIDLTRVQCYSQGQVTWAFPNIVLEIGRRLLISRHLEFAISN